MAAPLIFVWADADSGIAATAKTTAAIKDNPRNFRNGGLLTIAGVIATP
jgi:hypothetical protein